MAFLYMKNEDAAIHADYAEGQFLDEHTFAGIVRVDMLDWQGDIADTFQTYGRNTDTVSVFLCDAAAYMDELKGYYWSADYAEKKKTKTFAQYLEEHALYWAQVTFAE